MAGTTIPENLRYTKDHEWVDVQGNRARIGITDYAQNALTDVVFAELPEVGESFSLGDSLGVVESTKSVSDIFSPLTGRVVEANAALDESPELLNDDPYGKGWFCVLEIADETEVANLMDAGAYAKFLESL